MKRIATLLLAVLLIVSGGTPALSVGTIFGLPLSQQLDSNGKPLDGAKLFIYDANTSDPVTAYEDFGLETSLPHPIEADADGRIPEFWLPDGDYRVRLTDKNGIVKFDSQSITALGPSSGEDGDGDSVTDAQIATTGDLKWRLAAGTLAGWVRLNGRTIGSATSGATERANADTQSLYEYLYAICDNTKCPVDGGRGASAAADFAANKAIGVPDMRGRGLVALDTMGNTAASVLSGATTPIDSGGASTKTLSQSEIPPHSHASGSLAISPNPHNHDLDRGGATQNAESPGPQQVATPANGSTQSTSLSITGSTANTGGGNSFSLMNPYRLGTVYIKL